MSSTAGSGAQNPEGGLGLSLLLLWASPPVCLGVFLTLGSQTLQDAPEGIWGPGFLEIIGWNTSVCMRNLGDWKEGPVAFMSFLRAKSLTSTAEGKWPRAPGPGLNSV